MTASAIDPLAWRQPGYAIAYRPGEANHCPGCARQHWIVGRVMAECAFCGTALTLINVHGYGAIQRYATRGEGVRPLP